MCRDINRFPIKRGSDRESTPIRSGFFARKGESLYKLCRFNKSSESCELINEMKRDTRRRGYVCCAKWTRLCECVRARVCHRTRSIFGNEIFNKKKKFGRYSNFDGYISKRADF